MYIHIWVYIYTVRILCIYIFCRYYVGSIIPVASMGSANLEAIPTVPTVLVASERHYRSDRWLSAGRANDVLW